MADLFSPIGATVNVAVTGTSQALALTDIGSSGGSVRLTNIGTQTVYIKFGPSGVVATVAAGIPVAAGAADIFEKVTATHVAAIAGATGSTIYAASGLGGTRPAEVVVGPVLGTVTNDAAVAGYVGEQISAAVAAGSAVALTTATPANITSISLTPGDWDVDGVAQYTPGAATSITQLAQGSSATSATLGAQGSFSKAVMPAAVFGAIDPALVIPAVRVSLAATTTIYLVASATFTVGTLAGYGVLRARRVR